MANNLRDFYKTATRYGFARDNLLRLGSVTGDAGDGKDIFPQDANNQNFGIYLKTAGIPQRRINTSTIAFRSFDLNVPMGSNYPDNNSFNVTFFCDKYYILRDILERWSNATYNEHQFITTTDFTSCNVSLDLLDNSDPDKPMTELKTLKRYVLVGCFPNNISNTGGYDISSTGEIVTVQANLTFQYVTSETGPFNTN